MIDCPNIPDTTRAPESVTWGDIAEPIPAMLIMLAWTLTWSLLSLWWGLHCAGMGGVGR